MTTYNSLGYEIAMAHKSLKAKFQKVLKPHGVTVQQFEVMRVLMTSSGITAAQLVEYIISDSSTMMVILNRLESKNLITRKPDETDRRTKLIYLTKLGQNLVKNLMSLAEQYNSEIQKCCSDKELKTIRQVLSKLSAFSVID
jgi:MarR family transcriptional regulator, transcriptional regulator for hemolysin